MAFAKSSMIMAIVDEIRAVRLMVSPHFQYLAMLQSEEATFLEKGILRLFSCICRTFADYIWYEHKGRMNDEELNRIVKNSLVSHFLDSEHVAVKRIFIKVNISLC